MTDEVTILDDREFLKPRFPVIPQKDYDESQHPRDEHGRWTEAGSSLAQQLAKPDSGFTYSTVTHRSPTEGYVLSIHKDREAHQPIGEVNAVSIAKYVQQNKDLLGQSGNYLGAWHNPEDGQVYFDVSTVVGSATEAEKLGRTHHQLAYYDLAAGHSVAIKRGSYEYTSLAFDWISWERFAYTRGSLCPGADDHRPSPHTGGARGSAAALPNQPVKADAPDYILDELEDADDEGDEYDEILEDYADALSVQRINQASMTGSQWLMEQAVNLAALGATIQDFWEPRLTQASQERTREYITDWPEDLPPFGGGAPAGAGPRRGELTIRFNQMDARAAEWADRQSGKLVTYIQESEKARISELIARANREGLTVQTVAKQLRWVGLLPQHQVAVARYQRGLAEEGRPMDQVFRMGDKYRKKLLRFRTQMIARQELLSATHHGQLAAILDAVHHGEIDPSQTSRKWVTADDERLCPICEYMDGAEVEADEPWTLEDGTTVMIPQEAHIQCRCSWELITTPREDATESEEEE